MHGHTHQLISHFHGDLVMGDIDELNFLRHLLNQPRIATDVGVIQWRINFVEHAERRRIELEDRKYQRQRSQCFLAAGQ